MFKEPVKIIAEIGVNHNNDLGIARELIDVAKQSGADIVKFQLFSAAKIATETARTARYQNRGHSDSNSQRDLLSRLELTEEAYQALLEYATSQGVECIATAFDSQKIDFVAACGQKVFKIPSGELTNWPYLVHIARFGKPVLLSTGMSTLEEIGAALEVLQSHGLARSAITVLHCTSAYPAPYGELNLPAMVQIRDRFQVAVGYSDHSLGIEVAPSAVALGAEVIEKHITLDRTMEGPDQQASIEPSELVQMVTAIRNIEKAMLGHEKGVTNAELENKDLVRKSIVAKSRIRRGEVFSDFNLDTKRPGSGISPMKWKSVIGAQAKRDFDIDEMIEL